MECCCFQSCLFRLLLVLGNVLGWPVDLWVWASISGMLMLILLGKLIRDEALGHDWKSKEWGLFSGKVVHMVIKGG